jgi:Tfp pilus assembly protein FimT
VITVLIIGILAAVAAPKFSNSVQRLRAESAAKRIKANLGFARQNAVSTSSSQPVQFSPATNGYTLPGMADLNHSSQTYSVDLAAAPYNAVLVSATLGGDSDVQFNQYGQPDSGGMVTVESGGFQQAVSVDPDTGKASIP